MGAFPSLEPGRRLPPFPYAIAEKYAANTMGYGIVSAAKVSSAREDIGSQWDELKSYLQIGCPEAQADRLKWRTDIPLWHKELGFCPVSDDINTTPVSLYAGSWAGDVPWPANDPDKPRNRINLGNTVYFFCPAVVYDIKNKRVGMAFR